MPYSINTSLHARLAAIRSSFQFKLFFLFTLLTAAITFLFGTLFVVNALHDNKRHASEKLQLLTQSFADSIRLPLFAEDGDLLMRYGEEALQLPEIRGVEISAANGKVLVNLPAILPADAADFITKTVEVRSAAPALLPESFESVHDGRGHLVGYVRLYRGTGDLSATGRRLVATACALATLFWLLVSCSCYLLLRRVTRSFQALMLGLQNVHGGDYVSRIAISSDDEPGRASASVNELAETLRQRDELNRRLHAELVATMEVEIASKQQLVAVNLSLEQEIFERSRAKLELKNLVEQLPVGIVWSDCDGSIEYLNHFMLERIGYLPDEVRSIEQWLCRACPDPAYRERIARLRRAAIDAWENGATDTSFYDVRVVCKDGSARDLNCGIQLSGERIVDIMIDMTERELLQQQIIRNQKLESIGVLAGGIAHNFNNALTGVLGYISFARRFLDPSHKAYDLLLHGEKATKRAAGLANQLLSFAKGGAPIRRVVSIAKIVEESVFLATSGSKVVSSLELPPSLPYVYVDDGQICQAFNCICINAVQAMPEGGVLTVRGRNVSTGYEKLPVPAAGEYVELSFEDQGCGIREEDRSNIFTPYFTTKAELGTGLGLATVHSIISRHGGVISFVTEVGKGTTFTLYLPVVKRAAPEQQPDQKLDVTSASVAGRSILVMDDEELIRNLAGDVLGRQGYRVTLCANGAEAVSLYRQAFASGTPYLAAILDLTIAGGMGGKETAQQILALDPDARLIVSSGYSNNVVMNEYRKYGFCAASPKPYDAQELSRLLDELCQPAPGSLQGAGAGRAARRCS
ncbi:MAG: signal protein [Geobacteraceae bacterium GWC2_58_44]|nr:MAG: signal protein [Geobacteraceae bacterium GWC2_58_44]HBG06201.1 signal protein [Geobacter sp.]